MNINFIKNKNRFFIFSSAMIILVIVATFINGVKLDIQFKGGYISTYSYDGEIDKDKLESDISKFLNTPVSIQKTTDIISGLNRIVVSFGSDRGFDNNGREEQLVKLKSLLEGKMAHHNFKEIQVNNVDPTVGKEFFTKCMVAVIFAAGIMIIYIAIRFKKIGGWVAGFMAVIALVHDVIIVYGTFVILKLPINDNFIAVALMILGYSVNDTIVIYDRIRENKRIYGSKLPFGELVNKSINQSFARTINTTVTTVISVLVVLIIAYIKGVDSIISFVLPLLVGLIAGTYSTICIAGPLWVVWKEREKQRKLAKISNN